MEEDPVLFRYLFLSHIIYDPNNRKYFYSLWLWGLRWLERYRAASKLNLGFLGVAFTTHSMGSLDHQQSVYRVLALLSLHVNFLLTYNSMSAIHLQLLKYLTHALQDNHHKWSPHLLPYLVIIILLSKFPMLYLLLLKQLHRNDPPHPANEISLFIKNLNGCPQIGQSEPSCFKKCLNMS